MEHIDNEVKKPFKDLDSELDAAEKNLAALEESGASEESIQEARDNVFKLREEMINFRQN